MSSSATGGNPETSSQFWDDFWNTIYQFTHPLSSTFFDSLLDGDKSDTAESAPSFSPQPTGPIGKDNPTSQATGSPGSGPQYFKDEASFEKFWNGLKNGMNNQESSPSTPLEHVQAAWTDIKSAAIGFVSSVEWRQTWIQAILALHLIIFVLIISLRNRPNPLASLLFCTILLAALSEPLNGVGSRHWQQFSDDNYFDSYGVFTSVVWSAPLLGNAILAVLLLLRTTAGLLIKVKKAQLQDSKRKKQK